MKGFAGLWKILFDVKTAKDAIVSTISLFICLSGIAGILLCFLIVFQISSGVLLIILFLPSIFLGISIIVFVVTLFYYFRIIALRLMNEAWLITLLIMVAIVILKLEITEVALVIFSLFPLLWFEILILIARKKGVFIET